MWTQSLLRHELSHVVSNSLLVNPDGGFAQVISGGLQEDYETLDSVAGAVASDLLSCGVQPTPENIFSSNKNPHDVALLRSLMERPGDIALKQRAIAKGISRAHDVAAMPSHRFLAWLSAARNIPSASHGLIVPATLQEPGKFMLIDDWLRLHSLPPAEFWLHRVA